MKLIRVAPETAAADLPQVQTRLWDLSSDLMVVTDGEGRLQALNNAWCSGLGWAVDDLLDTNVLVLVHPEDLAATEAELASVAAGGETVKFENRLRNRDGQYRQISWRASPEGRFIYAVGRDITERLQREEALRQAQKLEALGQLTGGIAHDFNNLLTILRSSLDFLQRPDLPAARRQRYVEAMSSVVERAAKLTGQLLAFARRQALDPEVFDVRERIADVSELLRQLVGPRVEIVTVAPCEPCFVDADLCQFEAALMNLAINARDAMGGQGRLVLEARRLAELPPIRGHAGARADFVAISVTDTGVGISPEQLARVFDPFFTTKEVGKGSGLGLSQVYGFAKQSGGDVEVWSEPGKGATFTLYLPRTEQVPAARPEIVHAEPTARCNGRRALLVEDNDQVGSFCTDLLSDLGYSAEWAHNGHEALDLIQHDARGFDVVFTDVVMPGMSGIDLAETLRERQPDLPVVLTSGYSPVLADGRARDFPLVAKPYSLEEVSRALDQAIGRVGPRR